MIRSTNHSSYPRIGDHPLDQQLRAILKARSRGAATDEEVTAVLDEVTTVVVADQSRAFIDVVTDGMVRWDGPLSHLVGRVAGLEARELRRWFDTNFYDRRVAVVGAMRRSGPILLEDLRVAREVAQKRPVKAILPGPVTFARLCRDEHYGSPEAVAQALAGVLAEEVRELAADGTRWFQLEEPLLCRRPADVDLVARTAGEIFAAAGPEATTILGTGFGDLAALAGRLDALPGTHLGLDLVTAPTHFDVLARLPAGRGVVLGLFDARSSVQEDAADVAERLAPYRESLTQRDVLVGPNAGLEFLPRDQAFDKLLHARYLVEQLSREWKWAS